MGPGVHIASKLAIVSRSQSNFTVLLKRHTMVSLVNCHDIPLMISIFLHSYKCRRGSMTCPRICSTFVADLADGELVSSTPVIRPLSHPVFIREK